ncbi:MAG: hypothetical protein KAY24_00310 [Candidatus Eisenbacteria sp.]|nr:hypothetical protein [Candidatus Eisenbacteria bacterium]
MTTRFREEMKTLAKERGLKLSDLSALAVKNDPFMAGSPGDIEKAEWFAGWWKKFGYTSGVHLRRIHYQLVSQDPAPTRPDGKPYENTKSAWLYLVQAAKIARYLGYVDHEAFEDRRNPPPIIYAGYMWGRDPGYHVEGNEFELQMPTLAEPPDFTVQGYDKNPQPYHVEVWAEKSTMHDVLKPLCRRYDINLVAGLGELSITAVVQLVKRMAEADRPVRIFYIADFDPAGYGMPVSVARKIEFLVQDQDRDVKLEPLMLTGEQVRKYNLPRTPIKETELRRAKFEDAHGGGAVELDALEALHPGQLKRLVEKAILRYHDADIASKARQAKRKLEGMLEAKREEVLGEEMLERMAELHSRIEDTLADLKDEIESEATELAELYEKARHRLEQVEVEMPEMPEGRLVWNEAPVLYDSHRSYGEQLESYTRYKRGNR